MEGDSIKKKNSSKSSSIKKKNTRKKQVTVLSNDELYEQLKLKKQNKGKKTVTKSNNTVKRNNPKPRVKKDNQIENDLLYAQIKNKKKKQKTVKVDKDKTLIAENNTVENEIVKRILSGEYTFFDEIDEVTAENVDVKEEFIKEQVIEPVKEQVKELVKEPVKESVNEQEDIHNENLLKEIKDAVKEDKKKQDNLIITREIDVSEIKDILNENEDNSELNEIETIIPLGKKRNLLNLFKDIKRSFGKKKDDTTEIDLSKITRVRKQEEIREKQKKQKDIVKPNVLDKEEPKIELVQKEEKVDIFNTREVKYKENDLKITLEKQRKELLEKKKKEEELKRQKKEQRKIKWSNRYKKVRSGLKKYSQRREERKEQKQKRFAFRWSLLAASMVLVILFLILIVEGALFVSNSAKFESSSGDEVLPKVAIKKVEYDNRFDLYDECLERPLNEKDTSDEIESYITELNNYLKTKYNASIMYEDLTTGFKYEYNGDKSYYAASSMKILDALYIYEKASRGELSLDDTVVYQSRFRVSYSSGMSKHKIGEAISLRTLVSYAILYSDNTAHEMLISYIGSGNLNAYAKSLGATSVSISSAEHYGSITIHDAQIYLTRLNDFINNNELYGEEVKVLFINSDDDYLAIPDLGIKVAHKYGQYAPYYNQLGIVYDENPYIIAILTTNYNSNIENTIKDIHNRIYILHKMYNDNRDKVCYSEIFEK